MTRWVALAEVARPHGVRGEVRLNLFNAESDLLLDVDEADVKLQNARIGVVERLEEYPTTHVLVVKKDDGSTIEVPLTEAYVEKVDTEARVVALSSIEDL